VACGGRPMMITKTEYESAKLAYRNYSEYVEDTKNRLSRLAAEVKRLEKKIADYEKQQIAEGADDGRE